MEKIFVPSLISDIGSSLGGTLSATQALLNGAVQDPELRRDLLGGMDHELRYLRFLFENWVLLQTAQSGKIKPVFRRINISDWLATILVSWQKFATQKQLHWNVSLAESLPEIYADPDQLAQAIGNLTYASILCAPLSSEIKVVTLYQNDSIHINLCDSGPKINPLIFLDGLSGVFRQNFESHPRLKKGLGIGILLAHSIVAAHKGEITVNEVENYNFCVSIQLPI